MKFDREQLNREIDRVTKEWDMSGAFIVIKNGELVHEGIYGYEDRIDHRQMTRETTYILHSECAFLVRLCVFMLIDQGKLKFTDKLSRFIPEYGHAHQIKLIQMLLSVSGISDYFYDHLMIGLNDDEAYLALSDYDRKRMELKTLNENRQFDKVLSIVGQCDLLYGPGTKGRGSSETNWVFLAEVVKRVTGLSVFDYLSEHVFKPLSMRQTEAGYASNAVSSTVIRESERVRTPLDYPVTGVFTTTVEDMEKLLLALAEKKLLSEQMWERVLKYDSDGEGMLFDNANGFDCGNIAFLGFGFFFYFNHKSGIAFASLISEEQTFKNVAGEWHYFRRDSREVIEAAFTFPVQTKLVKLSKSNMWQALNLKVAEDQQGFVLEAKSSIAMALMYKTKHAFVEMEGSRIVGLLVLDIDKKKNYYNIDIILIDKRYQGRGYGKIMLAWAIERLKDEGAKELEIGVNRFNHAAKKIYLSAGFKPKAIYDGGMTLHMVIG